MSINGVLVEVYAGQTVLEVADATGHDIPRLCAHPSLAPSGNCRLCLVEVEGLRGYPTACTLAAAPGMVVHTETPAVQELRRATLGLLLTKHPTGCLLCRHNDNCLEHHGLAARRSGTVTGCRFCPNDGHCEFQDLVARVGVEDLQFPVTHRGLPVDRRNPFIDNDPNLCVLCARCTRVCAEVRGSTAIALQQRGEETLVRTAGDVPLAQTDCQFCGECIDICPTGSLSERVNKWSGDADQTVPTTCLLCGYGCQLELDLVDGQVVRSRPAEGHHLCVKGRFAPVELQLGENRALSPQFRRVDHLVPTDWDEALARAAAGLAAAAQPAVWASADLLDEQLAATVALADRLGTPHRDNEAAWLDGGAPSSTATLDDLGTARRIVTVRCDLRFGHTPLLIQLRAATERGAELYCVEPFGGDHLNWASALARPLPGAEHEALAPWLTGPDTVVVLGQGLLQADNLQTCLELAQQAGAKVLPLLGGANAAAAATAMGPGTGGLGWAAWWAEGSPIDALVTVGCLPGRDRPPVGFWVALTARPDGAESQADVVLPLTLLAEVAGHTTDLHGRPRECRAAVTPLDDCLPLAEVVDRLSALLPAAPARASVSAPPALHHNEAEADGLLVAVETSGFRHLGDSLARSVPGLSVLDSAGSLWLHPAEAGLQGLAGGQAVTVSTGRHAWHAVVRLSGDLVQGAGRLVLAPSDGLPAPPNPCRAQIVPS